MNLTAFVGVPLFSLITLYLYVRPPVARQKAVNISGIPPGGANHPFCFKSRN